MSTIIPDEDSPDEVSSPVNDTVNLSEADKLLSHFATLLKSETDQKEFLKAMKQGRPPGYSKASNIPYYGFKYGLQMKKVFDDLMANPTKQKIFYYKDFPNYTRRSLYLRINQSKKFLLDKLDPDKKYSDFARRVLTHARRGVGIMIYVVKSIEDETDDFTPKDLNPITNIEWKEQLDKYLSEAEYDKFVFHVKGLALSNEEVESLEVSLCEIPDLTYNITNSEIKVFKTKVS